MDFINFLNALFNYGIAAVGLLAVIVAAVISGKKLRDRNDSKKTGVRSEEHTSELQSLA